MEIQVGMHTSLVTVLADDEAAFTADINWLDHR
jgi:hypothetical protein